MLKNLFNGPSHAGIVWKQIEKMEQDMDSCNVTEFLSLSDKEIEATVESYVEKYAKFDVLELNMSAQEKILEKVTGQRFIEIPFSGDPSYFDYSPSAHSTQINAEIVNQKVRVRIDLDINSLLNVAEAKATELLTEIAQCLETMKHDIIYLYKTGVMHNTARKLIQNKVDLHKSMTEYTVL